MNIAGTAGASLVAYLIVGILWTVGIIATVFVYSFPMAVLLRISAKWVLKMRMRYWSAYRISVIASVVSSGVFVAAIALVVVAHVLVGASTYSQGYGAVPWLAGFLAQMAVYKRWLNVSPGRAALVVLVVLALWLAFVLGIAFVLGTIQYLIHGALA